MWRQAYNTWAVPAGMDPVPAHPHMTDAEVPEVTDDVDDVDEADDAGNEDVPAGSDGSDPND